MTIIYHGTPLTPRSALLNVGEGRAMCVSFFRPDDVEVVQAISPAIMFRQWGIFILEAGPKTWAGVGERQGLEPLFRLVGTEIVLAGALGGNSRHAGGSKPAQRRPLGGVAFWAARSSIVPHGCANRAPIEALRQIRPSVSRLDRTGEEYRLPRVSSPHGRGGPRPWVEMAYSSHDAGDGNRSFVSIHKRRQHKSGAKWSSLRQPIGRHAWRSVAREAGLC